MWLRTDRSLLFLWRYMIRGSFGFGSRENLRGLYGFISKWCKNINVYIIN